MFPPDTIVLVVDDSNTIRQAVRKELAVMGYTQIKEAEDGKQALDILEASAAENKPIGLAICDWNMPIMNGLDLLKTMRANPKWASLPFIMLTSASQISEVVSAIAAGVSTYIVKPLDSKALKEKMSAAWQKHNVKP